MLIWTLASPLQNIFVNWKNLGSTAYNQHANVLIWIFLDWLGKFLIQISLRWRNLHKASHNVKKFSSIFKNVSMNWDKYMFSIGKNGFLNPLKI